MTRIDATTESVPVVIVGGGPTGLIASILLGRFGVANLLVEKRSSTSVFPKARKLNTRTMEILRVLGIEDEVRADSDYVGDIPLMLGGETLSGPVHLRIEGEPYEASHAHSPTTWAFCPQDRFEPILRRHAEREPASDVRFGVEVTDITEHAEGVALGLLEGATGRRWAVHARYVIAADGAHSFVRRTLGIGMSGDEESSDQLNVLFHADLEPIRGSNRSVLFKVQNDAVDAVIGMAGQGRWIMLCADFPGASPERCSELVRAAAGAHDLEVEVEVEAITRWQLVAVLADRFGSRRTFLAGDAAHRLQPNGAFGLNTGVGDAHNLAWKLCGVLHGWAGEDLLDSYGAERRPVALRNAELSRHFWDSGTGSALGYVLGYTYETGALLPDGEALPPVADPVSDYIPNARPGSRAPHWWLAGNGESVSSLDLFDRQLIVLTDHRGWCRAAADVALSGTPLHPIQPADRQWAARCGIGQSGALLVRPDGHVALRTRSAPSDTSVADLRGVLEQVLCTRRHAITGMHSCRSAPTSAPQASTTSAPAATTPPPAA